MKIKIQLLVFSIFIATCPAQTSSADIEYFVQPRLTDSIPVLHVEFESKSDSSGSLVLRYENDSWGDKDIFNCIRNFNVSPAPESILFQRDSSRIIIRSTPNTNLVVRYEIAKDYKGPPLNQYRYRPIVDTTHFHVLGMRLFMVPERVFPTDSHKAKIRIRYSAGQEEGLFHSSFGKNTLQDIHVQREELYASFFVGGDYRRYSFTQDTDTIYFLTRGHWNMFNDQDILGILKETFSAQRRFWKDPGKGNFSVTLTPTYESWYSIGGSGFSSSFISFASNNDKVKLSQMQWLYNHELLHKYIGRTIKNENEVEQYWFSEGFTDYYAYKLMLKNNSLDVSRYLDILNREVIIPHYNDPFKNLPNAQLTFQEYWSNYVKYMKLPYRRGLLYAFFLDNKIKEESNYTHSLDNVMQDIFLKALNEESMRLNATVFIDHVSKYLKQADIKADFDRYILEGMLIDFENRLPEGMFLEHHNGIPLLKADPEKFAELEKKLKF